MGSFVDAQLYEQVLDNYNARFLHNCIASHNAGIPLDPRDVAILAEQAELPASTLTAEIFDELLKRYTLKRITRRLKS